MAIPDDLRRLKDAYAAAGLNHGDGLLPPASEAEIEGLSRELGLPIPEGLREIYRLHAGQEYINPGTTGLFGRHRLSPFSEVVELYEMECGNCEVEPSLLEPEARYWDLRLLPFGNWDAYLLCIHVDTGAITDFRPGTGLMPLRARSLEGVIEELIGKCAAGAKPELEYQES